MKITTRTAMLLICCFFCLLFVTACPIVFHIIIANKSSGTIEILDSDGTRRALLKNGTIKKTLFPSRTAENPDEVLIYLKIENTIYIYKFPSIVFDPKTGYPTWGPDYIKSGKTKVIFHEDRKFYLIPYKASWEDSLQNHKQPKGWPVSPAKISRASNFPRKPTSETDRSSSAEGSYKINESSIRDMLRERGHPYN